MKIIISESQYRLLVESDKYISWIKRRWDEILNEYFKLMGDNFLSPKKYKDEDKYVETFFSVLMDILHPKMIKYFDDDSFYDEIRNKLKSIFEEKIRKHFRNS